MPRQQNAGALTLYLSLICAILAMAITVVFCREIAECDGQRAGIYLPNLRPNCNYPLIYCNGTLSQYCFAENVCNERNECSNQTNTSNTPSITTPPQSTTMPVEIDVRLRCGRGINAKFVYPYNCNYFYHCIDGYLLVQQCPFGYTYNSREDKCTGLLTNNCLTK